MEKVTMFMMALAFVVTMGTADGQFSMSQKDRALYSDMQENNPGDIYVDEGNDLFDEMVTQKALAKFLDIPKEKLPEVIASFPRYIPKVHAVLGLDQVMQAVMYLNGHTPFKLKSDEMFEMLAYVKSLANGLPIGMDINRSRKMQAAYRLGKKTFETRRGKRGLSCKNCHSKSVVGLSLRTQKLPDLGAVNAGGTWPAYRMTKSSLRTLQRRFQGCMKNALMAPLPIGSKEMVALEIYVTQMAKQKGKKIEIPGLKR